ncbi:10149_t:CDS:2, partial [Dentiscutata erythropus]
RKRKLDSQQNEVALALDALRSNPSTSIIKKPRNTNNETIIQSTKSTKKVSQPLNQSINDGVDVDNIDDNTQNFLRENTESVPRLLLSKSFTNTLGNLTVDDENTSNSENKTMKLILETTKQILSQSISIIEKYEALESAVTLLSNDVKALQSLNENFKLNTRDHDNEWWQ